MNWIIEVPTPHPINLPPGERFFQTVYAKPTESIRIDEIVFPDARYWILRRVVCNGLTLRYPDRMYLGEKPPIRPIIYAGQSLTFELEGSNNSPQMFRAEVYGQPLDT